MIEDQIEIEQYGLIYSIDEYSKTANIIGHKSITNKIFIPRSINYKSDEYIVTTISQSAFEESDIESVEFASDSEIQIIEEAAFFHCNNLRIVKIPKNSKIQKIGPHAFGWTSIERFTIPEHLTCICQNTFSTCYMLKEVEIPIDCDLQTIESCAFEESPIQSLTISSKLINLEEGWSESLEYLESIKVSPNNPRYCLFDGELLIGKSSLENDNFDVIVLCVKNIKKLTIPSFIKIIGHNAFSFCSQLQTIEFTENSELQIIDKFAFLSSSIEFLKIPSHLKIINERAFSQCRKLKTIEVPINSELQRIGSCAFGWSTIESFTFPSNLIFLENGWCNGTKNLIKIDISSSNPLFKTFENKFVLRKLYEDNENFTVLAFCFRNVRNITIPSFIEIIDSFSFCYCESIQKVIIPQNSELIIFGNSSFCDSSINRITIPNYTLFIGSSAFYECQKLSVVEINDNSELEEIGERAFFFTPITSFSIPASLKHIRKSAFANCMDLQIVEFNDFSKIKVIETNSFYGCNQLIITVSVNITESFKESLVNLLKTTDFE